MLTEEGNTTANSSKQDVSNRAYYGAVTMPPPFFTSSAVPPATSHSSMWGNQYPVIQPYRTPIHCPFPYHQNGFFTHSNVVEGLDSTSEAKGKTCYWKDCDAMRKCNGSSESLALLGDGLGESNKSAQSYQITTQSGHDDTMDECEDEINHKKFPPRKIRSCQMLTEESDTQNDNATHFSGANHLVPDNDHLVSMPESNLNMTNSNALSGKSKSTMVRDGAPDHPAVSTKNGASVEVMDAFSIQDEIEMEKARKRRAHNESARRSRIRRQKICESLQAQAEELSWETSKLKRYLNGYSKNCMKLRRKNKALLEELRQICTHDEIAMLEADNPDPNPSESASEYSSSDQSVDTSNSSSDDEANKE